MFERLANWLEGHALSCFYKKHLGIECPGCGMQRSMAELLRGDLLESIRIFPALIPILFMISFLVLHLIFKWKNGGTVLKYSFIFTAVIMVVNFTIKVVEGRI